MTSRLLAADAPPAADVTLDQKALDNLRAIQRPGGPSVLKRVIEMYLQSTPTLLQALRDAATGRNDPEAMRHAAHSLKSSSASIGATALAELCRDLEYMGRDGSIAGADVLVARIDAIFPRVCEQLAVELDRIAA